MRDKLKEKYKEAVLEGYDLIFEYKGDTHAVKTNEWNDEKAADCFRLTGLKAFRENIPDGQLVFYDPNEWEVASEGKLKWLHYTGNSCKPSMPINCTSLAGAFAERADLTELDLTAWDTSKLRYMTGMCMGCSNLVNLNLAELDVRSLINADSMCKGCASIVEVNLTGWHPVKLISAKKWFFGCMSLQEVKFNQWEKWQIDKDLQLDSAWDACKLVAPAYLAEMDDVDILLDMIDGKGFTMKNVNPLCSF